MSLTQSQNCNEDPNYLNPNEIGNTMQQPLPHQNLQRRTRAFTAPSKIKWRDIMKIDLDLIARTNDLSVLEYYLENIVYSDISEDEVQSVPEGNLVKLIKVCQFTLEYFLSTQQALEANCRSLEAQNSQLNCDLINKDQQLKDCKDQIRTLKKEKKHNETVLLTYKNVIDNRHYKPPPKQSVNQSQTDSVMDESKQRFYCKYCKGKKYSTEELLNNHLHKRHLIETPMMKESRGDGMKGEGGQFNALEKKLEDMKSHFEGYLKQMQEEGSMKQLENQKKIEEDKHSRHLEDMGNNFKNTLNELKEFYMQNTIKGAQHQPIQVTSAPIEPMPMIVSNPNDQMATILKEELTKLNEGLFHISSQQDQKLNSLSEKLNSLKRSEAQVHPQSQSPMEPPQQQKPHSEQLPQKEREEPPLRIAPQQSTTFSKVIPSKKPDKRKTQFNAGPIESDNDSDEDKKKKKKKHKKELEDTELIAGLKNATSNFNELVNKGKLKQSYRAPSKEMQMSFDGNASVKELDDKAPKAQKSESPKSIKPKDSAVFIDPKESFGVTAKTFNKPRLKSDLLDEFNAFEKKYNHRDHEFNQLPREHNYLMETLPQHFNMSQNMLATTLKASFLQTAKKNTLNEQLDYEEIEKESKDGILSIINKTLKNITSLNTQNKEIGDYYQSLQQYLDLQLYEKEMKELEEGSKAKKAELKKVEYLKEKHDDVISEANNINSKAIPNISAKNKREDSELEEMNLDHFDS